MAVLQFRVSLSIFLYQGVCGLRQVTKRAVTAGEFFQLYHPVLPCWRKSSLITFNPAMLWNLSRSTRKITKICLIPKYLKMLGSSSYTVLLFPLFYHSFLSLCARNVYPSMAAAMYLTHVLESFTINKQMWLSHVDESDEEDNDMDTKYFASVRQGEYRSFLAYLMWYCRRCGKTEKNTWQALSCESPVFCKRWWFFQSLWFFSWICFSDFEIKRRGSEGEERNTVHLK